MTEEGVRVLVSAALRASSDRRMQRAFGLPPGEAGMSIVHVRDERGMPVAGAVIDAGGGISTWSVGFVPRLPGPGEPETIRRLVDRGLRGMPV